MCEATKSQFGDLRREETGAQAPLQTLALGSGSCRAGDFQGMEVSVEARADDGFAAWGRGNGNPRRHRPALCSRLEPVEGEFICVCRHRFRLPPRRCPACC
ncbi:MAG: hypothetical protein KGJ55_02750 [Gammaproteobacteria bacterium]|nr:hypothetical protein [Gammaproteobacteria bacterium]